MRILGKKRPGALGVLLAAALPCAAGATTFVVHPGDAWCGLVNGASAGDTILFSAGTYTDTCSITSSGTALAPITLRSATAAPADRAFLAYAGSSSNILDVYGS